MTDAQAQTAGAPVLGTEAGAVPAPPDIRDGWTPYRRVLGWLLFLAVAAIAGSVLVGGAKHEPYDQLARALESGEVTAVEVAGHGPRPTGKAARGYSTVQVHWRDGLLTRWTEVTQASSPRQARIAERSGAGAVVVTDDLAAHWRERQPGLVVEPGAWHSGGTLSSPQDGGGGGYQVPSWSAPLALVVGWALLVQLVLGPQPLRATRWAWFWFMVWKPWIAAPAYLMLGGPTGVGGRPRTTFRLSGWHLVLAATVLYLVFLLGSLVRTAL